MRGQCALEQRRSSADSMNHHGLQYSVFVIGRTYTSNVGWWGVSVIVAGQLWVAYYKPMTITLQGVTMSQRAKDAVFAHKLSVL